MRNCESRISNLQLNETCMLLYVRRLESSDRLLLKVGDSSQGVDAGFARVQGGDLCSVCADAAIKRISHGHSRVNVRTKQRLFGIPDYTSVRQVGAFCWR